MHCINLNKRIFYIIEITEITDYWRVLITEIYWNIRWRIVEISDYWRILARNVKKKSFAKIEQISHDINFSIPRTIDAYLRFSHQKRPGIFYKNETYPEEEEAFVFDNAIAMYTYICRKQNTYTASTRRYLINKSAFRIMHSCNDRYWIIRLLNDTASLQTAH